MSQNSLVIQDGTGASVLAAINNAINSLVTQNGGAGAPGSTYAYMFWADQTTGYLKQRNTGNTAWNILCKLDQDALAALQSQLYTAFTSAGTAPTYTLTPVPALTAYAANQRFRVKAHAAGTTGSNTLNVNALGAKNLKQYDATGAKVPAVVTNGQLFDVEYDGTDFVILDPLPPSGDSLPIGGMMTVVGATVPDSSKYLPFNGSSYLRASYPNLSPLMPDVYTATTRTGVAATYPMSYNAWAFYCSGLTTNKWVMCVPASAATATTLVMSSADMVTWTGQTLPASTVWNAYAASSSMVIALSGSANVTSGAYTTNGTSWTAMTTPSSGTYGWACVGYGGGRFVAVQSGATGTMYSTNGTTWTSGGALPFVNNYAYGAWGVSYLGAAGLFIVRGANSTSTATYATSPDGVTWTSRTTPFLFSNSSAGLPVGTFNQYYYATDNVGNVWKTSDGINWTKITSLGSLIGAVGVDIVYCDPSNNLFVTTPDNYMLVSSDNGASFAGITKPTVLAGSVWATDGTNYLMWYAVSNISITQYTRDATKFATFVKTTANGNMYVRYA